MRGVATVCALLSRPHAAPPCAAVDPRRYVCVLAGAYWLNPAVPSDADGYAVDPDTGERQTEVRTAGGQVSNAPMAEADDGDVDLAQLLADVDPL